MKTNIKINERNKGFYFHKVPHGLNVSKTKSQAMKDITEYIRSGNTDFGEINYLPLEPLILKLTKNENLVVSEKKLKKLPFIHCKENIREKPTVEIYVKEIFLQEVFCEKIKNEKERETFKPNFFIYNPNFIPKKVEISTPKKQKDWANFVLELNKKGIYKIFKNGEEVFKYQLFWSGVSVEDIIERRYGYDWKNYIWQNYRR